MIKTINIEVWHGTKQDDYEVTEVTTALSFTEYLRNLYLSGGFRWNDEFVPWHRVNYIRVV